MGNCLVNLQVKTVKVMKTDGKIIEYSSPVKVHQVLSQYSDHAISDQLPVVKHLHPNTDMLRGHLYYLLPLPVAPARPAKKKKTVRFADDVVQLEAAAKTTGVVRIKVVISKQELQAMLGKGGGIAVEDMISHLQKESSIDRVASIDGDRGNYMASRGRFPTLESIPELN